MSAVLESKTKLPPPMASETDTVIPCRDLTGDQERNRLLFDLNNTSRKYPHCDGLHRMFETQAAACADLTAVVSAHENREVTYRWLNERANVLAHFLIRNGVGPDVVVGVCLERCVDLVVAVLAVLKAGGAYVPFDPAYPKERLSFMLEDTQAPILLTQEKLVSTLPEKNARLLCLDREWDEIRAHGMEGNTGTRALPDHLAYLIYTSGSTGKPKGVAMRQEPLINLLHWQLENWSYSARARTLQFASLNFDVSFQEILSTLASGGTLILIDEETRRDSNELVSFLGRQRVNRLFLPFVALKHLADASDRAQCWPEDLKEVITAGEQLQITPQILRFFQHLPGCTLENQYGPSESHVVTAHRLQGPPETWPALPTIGKPIANCQIYLLDTDLQPVPNGVPGELFIGGACLAQGYLNRPDLSAEKFIPNPLSGTPGTRIYKAGDLARYLPDGNIEFLGRLDHQVKINGFRIELGELETVLSKHPKVAETVVVARDRPSGDKQLVAYIVPKDGEHAGATELRSFLKELVPAYAVPSTFVSLSSLPLTPNGKVDRKALPEPPQQVEFGNDEDFKQPQTPLEMQIRLVFERFLNRRPISTTQSFFELGGDSLQALKLILEVERETGKKLALSILYQASTIEGLARVISQGDEAAWSALVPLQKEGVRPTLYMVHTTPGDVIGYGNLIFHLGTEQPCYGFQSLGLKQKELSHTRIEEMAGYYVNLLREHQKEGPYHLAGWCYGGILAVEMARILQAQGQKVAYLGLIETPAPEPGKNYYPYYLRRFSCLLLMRPGQWRRYLSEKTKYYKSLRQANEMRFKRADLDEAPDHQAVQERNLWLDQLEHVYHTNLNALKGYCSRRFQGQITLYNAAQSDPAVIYDPYYGWKGLASQIQRHVVLGDHDSILMEPNVGLLAKQMQEDLARAGRK